MNLKPMTTEQHKLIVNTCDRMLNVKYFTLEQWIAVITEEWEKITGYKRKEPLSDSYGGKYLKVWYIDTKAISVTKSGYGTHYEFNTDLTSEVLRKKMKHLGWDEEVNLRYNPKVSHVLRKGKLRILKGTVKECGSSQLELPFTEEQNYLKEADNKIKQIKEGAKLESDLILKLADERIKEIEITKEKLICLLTKE